MSCAISLTTAPSRRSCGYGRASLTQICDIPVTEQIMSNTAVASCTRPLRTRLFEISYCQSSSKHFFYHLSCHHEPMYVMCSYSQVSTHELSVGESFGNNPYYGNAGGGGGYLTGGSPFGSASGSPGGASRVSRFSNCPHSSIDHKLLS